MRVENGDAGGLVGGKWQHFFLHSVSNMFQFPFPKHTMAVHFDFEQNAQQMFCYHHLKGQSRGLVIQ